MGYLPSLGSKAAHFVSDLTTVILNPVSERETSHLPEVDKVQKSSEDDKDSEHGSDIQDGPDTSSFRAFLISFLSSSSSNNDSMEILPEQNGDTGYPTLTPVGNGSKGKTWLISRGKYSIGKIINKAARFGGFKHATAEPKMDKETVTHTDSVIHRESVAPVLDLKESKEVAFFETLPTMSEPSVLLSEMMQLILYTSLPVLAQGRNWVLLYSTWRHGISLSTLYRRSMLCPGFSLLVVGDKNGTVFGGLVESPLQPTSAKKYQGTNNCFVFTNVHNRPMIYRPTGANNYFTMCSTDYLALGGGGHFALYLDGDLLTGSSSSSETFNNVGLSHSPDFAVKDVEVLKIEKSSIWLPQLLGVAQSIPSITKLGIWYPQLLLSLQFSWAVLRAVLSYVAQWVSHVKCHVIFIFFFPPLSSSLSYKWRRRHVNMRAEAVVAGSGCFGVGRGSRQVRGEDQGDARGREERRLTHAWTRAASARGDEQGGAHGREQRRLAHAWTDREPAARREERGSGGSHAPVRGLRQRMGGREAAVATPTEGRKCSTPARLPSRIATPSPASWSTCRRHRLGLEHRRHGHRGGDVLCLPSICSRL